MPETNMIFIWNRLIFESSSESADPVRVTALRRFRSFHEIGSRLVIGLQRNEGRRRLAESPQGYVTVTLGIQICKFSVPAAARRQPGGGFAPREWRVWFNRPCLSNRSTY